MNFSFFAAKRQQQFSGTSDSAMFAAPAAVASTVDKERDEGGTAGPEDGGEGEIETNG